MYPQEHEQPTCHLLIFSTGYTEPTFLRLHVLSNCPCILTVSILRRFIKQAPFYPFLISFTFYSFFRFLYIAQGCFHGHISQNRCSYSIFAVSYCFPSYSFRKRMEKFRPLRYAWRRLWFSTRIFGRTWIGIMNAGSAWYCGIDRGDTYIVSFYCFPCGRSCCLCYVGWQNFLIRRDVSGVG